MTHHLDAAGKLGFLEQQQQESPDENVTQCKVELPVGLEVSGSEPERIAT
jgi:hypothetical protein